jgi:hypothetical protein
VSTATTGGLGLVKVSTTPVSPSNPIVLGENDVRFLTSFTGGSYSNGTLSLNNVSGGTYNVTGFLSNATTAVTLSSNVLSVTSSGGTPTNTTINATTGGTYSNGIITLEGTGTLSTITGLFTGSTDIRVTGATYNNNTFTYTNNTGGTFNVLFNTITGLTSTGTISSNTISATTYQNYPTQDLATTLGYGNNTGAYDIEMASTRVIKTDNGGGQIDLDFGANANQVIISTDSGVLNESYLRMVDSSSTHLGTSTDFFSLTPSSTTVNWTNGFSLNGKFSTGVSDNIILTKDNGSSSFTSASNDMAGVIISSYNSTISSGIRNVAIVGGSSVTATTSATLYTNSFNLWITPTNNNTNTQILTRNSTTGNVEYRDSSSLSGSSITGVTYSANTLSLNRNGGQPSLTTTVGLKTKSGSVASGSFTGTPRTASVTFTTAFSSTNYSIQITGSDNRTFTYQSKATTGFTINTNANTPLTGNVDWVAIEHGES